jgi:hypothetical protein
MAKKQEIKEEIAHLLMRSGVVGMLENAIIQQVAATSNVDAITITLKEMASLGEAKRDGKRWKITPVGRSFYSDLNNKKESQPSEAADKLITGINNAAETLSQDAGQGDKAPKTNIERIESFRTPDGEIHTTQEAAEMHMLRHQLLPSIDAFMAHIGSTCKQKGLIRSYITRWEQFKREQAA